MPYRIVELLNECKHVAGDPPPDNRGRTCLGQYLLGEELHKEGVAFAPEAVARFARAVDAALAELTATPLSVARDLKGQRFSDVADMANRYAKTTSAAYVLVEAAIDSIEKQVPIQAGGCRTTGKETGLRRHARRATEFLSRHSPKGYKAKAVAGPTMHAAAPSSAHEHEALGARNEKAQGLPVSQPEHSPAATNDYDLERSGWRRIHDTISRRSNEGQGPSDTIPTAEEDALAAKTDVIGERYARGLDTFLERFHKPAASSSAYNIVPRKHRSYSGEGPTIKELRDLVQLAMPTDLLGENETAEFLPTPCGVDFVPDDELMLVQEPLRDVENWAKIDPSGLLVDAGSSEATEDPAIAAAEKLALSEAASKIRDRTSSGGQRSCLWSGPAGTGKSHQLLQLAQTHLIVRSDVLPFFINFVSQEGLPVDRLFKKDALARVHEESKAADEDGVKCFAYVDEYAQLTEVDLAQLQYMTRIYMAGDERQAFKTRVWTTYREFMIKAGGTILEPEAIWRAENRKLSALMTYLFYSRVQPPLGKDDERSMVQMHFCRSTDRRAIALRMFAHAMKLNRATILCDDVAMRRILQDLFESHEFPFKKNMRLISSKDLPGHQCWTLVLWIDEHDRPEMDLFYALLKTNLLLGRAAFRLSLVCSVPRVANRDCLFSTLLLTALSNTPMRPPLLEDKQHIDFDRWMFNKTGHNVRSDRGYMVIVKAGVVVCTVSISKYGEGDADERLQAAARLSHRKIVFVSETSLPQDGEDRWRMLAEDAGIPFLEEN